MRSRNLLVGAAAATALALTGCANSPASPSGSTSDGGRVRIVASTDVYGDIAARIGGDLVEVTSIVTGSAQDPHSYEASARDQLAISRAALVIENGGGYDPFIDTLLDGLGEDSAAVVNASEASGLLEEEEAADEHAGDEHDEHSEGEDGHEHIEGFNEHVWYSFPAVDAIADEVAHELGELDDANAAAYDENYRAFSDELDVLRERARSIQAQTAGRDAAITEPVPLYLLEDAGLGNATPPEFSEAIEEGDDVPPAVLQDILDVFSGGTVALLAYNEQTASSETEAVREAAEGVGVPVVDFTETLPEGMDYLQWMASNLDAIEAALA